MAGKRRDVQPPDAPPDPRVSVAARRLNMILPETEKPSSLSIIREAFENNRGYPDSFDVSSELVDDLERSGFDITERVNVMTPELRTALSAITAHSQTMLNLLYQRGGYSLGECADLDAQFDIIRKHVEAV